MTARKIDFRRIAEAALGRADTIIRRWLPDGRRDGAEWVSRNPTRNDGRPGSFKVNVTTGKWGDFATGSSRRGSCFARGLSVHAFTSRGGSQSRRHDRDRAI